MIEYKGKEYETRVLNMGKQRGCRTVAQKELGDLLYPGDGSKPADKKAEKIDDTIYYYCDQVEWEMSEKELIKYLNKNV